MYTSKTLTTGLSAGYHPSLLIRPDGLPFISCSHAVNATGSSTVSVFLCNDEACETFSVLSNLLPAGASLAGWTSAALVGGKASVAFVASSGATSIICYWRDGSSTSVVHSSSTAQIFQWGSDRNMAVQSPTIGNPFIVTYADGIGLLLVVCSNVACRPDLVRVQVLDGASLRQDVGLYPSMVVHPDTGLAVVAYHDATNLALKMAFCSNIFCTNHETRAFPSTFGWDPSVIFSPTTGLPIVAFSNPSTSALNSMACADPRCNEIAIASLLDSNSATSVRHRFESVKQAQNGVTIVHDTVNNGMYAVVLPGGCNQSACISITITSPRTTPSSTRLPTLQVTGLITGAAQMPDITLSITQQVSMKYDTTNSNFTAVVALQPGSNLLVISAVNMTSGLVLGSSTIIVVSDGGGPMLAITNPPLNGTSTVLTEIFVQGTASAVTGVASVSLLNLATNVYVSTATTSPSWSGMVTLLTNTLNIITVTATDNLGNNVTRAVSVFQTGLAAQIICPNSLPSLECGSVIPFSAVRIINCQETPILSESVLARCGGTKVLTRQYTACLKSCSYNITTVDTTPPIIVCPAPTTVACSDSLPQPGLSDLCSEPVTFSMSPASLTCSGTAQQVSLTASDACGNRASCNYQVLVSGPILPTTTTVMTAAITTTPSAGLSGGGLGALIAGIVLLLLLLLLVLLVALWWLRRRKRRQDESGTSVPIMLDVFHDDDVSSSTSSVTHSKLYRKPENQSSESQDFKDVF